MQYSRASEAPDAFHFWTGVSTIAGAVRRRVWVDEYIYDITPNFYIILVAPAGVATKSTTVNLGQSLLEKVPYVKFGPNSGSWQGIGDALQESIMYFKLNPDDETEKPIPMSPLTIVASELGTFLRPEDSHAMSFLTDTWDGKRHTFRHKTKHSGEIGVVNPWMNIIGATTPTWIRNNVPEEMIGEGLFSRIIFVAEDTKRKLVARPSKEIRSQEFYRLEEWLIEDLIHISNLVGKMDYTPEADEWMTNWYAEHNRHRPIHMASDRFSGYLSRKQTHLIKLAMILSIAQRDTLMLECKDLDEANSILAGTEQSMLKVFESIGVVSEAQHMATLLQYVRTYGWISGRDLRKLTMNTISTADFERALHSAIEANLLQVTVRDNQRGLEPTKAALH